MRIIATSALTSLLLLLLPASPLGARNLILPDSSPASLEEGWAWARAQISDRDSGWILWEFTTVLDEKVDSQRRYGNWHFNHPGLSLDAMLSGNTRAQQPYARERRVLVMALVERGRLSQIETAHREEPIDWQHPVYWLGSVSSEQSFRLLRDLLEPSLPRGTAHGLIDALGLHDHPDRTAYLTSLFAAEDWAPHRPQLIASLAQRQSPQVEALLLELSTGSRMPGTVRAVAIAALGRYSSEAVLAQLLSLSTDESQAPALREQAIETLVWFEAGAVGATLNQLAWFDAHEGVREAAVEALSALALQDRDALLLDIARNHPSADTREEALETLQSLLF